MLAAARTVVTLGIVLQVAGFAKLLAVAAYFGAGPVLDAYYLGLVIPTFLAGVSAGILQTAFVPPYVAALARGDQDSARLLANVTLTWVTLLVVVVTAIVIATRGVTIPRLVQGTAAETHAALRDAFEFLAWSAPLNVLADAGALLLNAEGRFAAAAGAPLLNILVGVLVLVAWHEHAMDALVLSLLAGLVAQTLFVLLAIRSVGIHLRPAFTLPAALPRLLGTVATPVVLSMVLGNLIPAFIQTFSARAGPGAVSAMGYGTRLNNALVQAVVLSISAILLPHFARLLVERRNAELRTTLERVFAATFLFTAATLVLVAAGGPPLVHLLLQRGNFTAADSELVARVWLALTAGLLGTTWGIFLARLFQALRMLWFIFASGCVSVVANVALAYSLLPVGGVVVVALANSIAYTIVMLMYHKRAGRIVGTILGPEARFFVVRTILASVVAYALCVGWEALIRNLGVIAVITGQAAIVCGASLLVAATPPLRIPVRSLLRL